MLPRPLRGTVEVALVCLLLSGCGGGDASQRSDPTSPTSGAGSPSASTSTPSGESPSVEPATGDTIETSFFTVQVPEGFRAKTLGHDFAYSASERHGISYIALNLNDTYGNPRLDTLDGVAALTLESAPWVGKPKRVHDTELGGEPAYHFAAPSGNTYLDIVGALHDGQSVSISFDLSGSADERQALVDSVLATWQWK